MIWAGLSRAIEDEAARRRHALRLGELELSAETWEASGRGRIGSGRLSMFSDTRMQAHEDALYLRALGYRFVSYRRIN